MNGLGGPVENDPRSLLSSAGEHSLI